MSDQNDVQTIDQQIAALQAKKQELLNAKRKDALQEAKKIIRTFGFSASELGLGGASATRSERAAKYANPDNSAETWHGGKGPKPKWVREKLAQGRTLEDLLIR